MNTFLLITLFLVSIRQCAQASQNQWKFDSEDSDAYLDRIHRFNKSVIIWRIDQFPRNSTLSKADLKHVIRTATDTWADVIPVDFLQSFIASEEVDITIRFLDSALPDQKLADCTYTKPVRIRFNGDVKFVIGDAVSAANIDIFTIALHELGHALGLRGHSSVPNSLMASRYSGRFTGLTVDVVMDIQALYGVRVGERTQTTTVQIAPTPTTTLFSASRQYCTPGKYYCGWQLNDMGYLFEGIISDLYLCDNNSQGIYFTDCPYCPDCIISRAFGSHCYCPAGEKYCGHLMEHRFNIKMPNWHAVYECENAGSARLISNCPYLCVHDSCKNVTRSCKGNFLHCGHEIVERGLVYPSQKLDLKALYYCNNTHVPVERCPGRCEEKYDGNSFCKRLVARKPF